MEHPSDIQEKYRTWRENLRALGSVAVAFSGGVDSTFLLTVAHDALGNRALAVTAVSGALPTWERDSAVKFCKKHGVRQVTYAADDLVRETFLRNPPNRCYLCKRALFTKILELSRQEGIAHVAEGSNMDDLGDYRPGLVAIRELGVLSPLRDAGLTKADIRHLSRGLGLDTWDKPSYACLASRFAYGEPITDEKLRMVEQAERLLLESGFHQVRVRVHGTLARLELLPADLPRLLQDETLRNHIHTALQSLGFSYVSLDLRGYRTGSMNETLPVH